VAPEDLENVPLVELRLIDPHLEGYVRHVAGGQVAVCQDCGDQLDALAGELEAYRRRLLCCAGRFGHPNHRHAVAPSRDLDQQNCLAISAHVLRSSTAEPGWTRSRDYA